MTEEILNNYVIENLRLAIWCFTLSMTGGSRPLHNLKMPAAEQESHPQRGGSEVSRGPNVCTAAVILTTRETSQGLASSFCIKTFNFMQLGRN